MGKQDNSYNLIITGVGGQGNVLASQLVGQAFVNKGYFVTIGETYGASQRGGPVMSHIRISENKQLSPLIPQGQADIIMALGGLPRESYHCAVLAVGALHRALSDYLLKK